MITTSLTDQQLAGRIEQALRSAAYDCDGTCGLDERECDAQHPIQVAVLHYGVVASVYGDVPDLAAVAAAVVQPELDRLAAELGQVRAELARRRTDDLTIRGALAPADGPRHVPMALGDSVTPAVEWLIADRNRLTVELEQARQQTEAVPCADCGHVEAAHSENGDRDCTASGARVTSCSCSYFIPPST